MTEMRTYRLAGLEPDNLLAFLALLGLLRSLQAVHPEWHPRARWATEAYPLRPELLLRVPATQEAVCAAAAEGIALLAQAHNFGGRADLSHTRAEARVALQQARAQAGPGAGPSAQHAASLTSALLSDAAIKDNKDQVEATPLCLLFGQGHQHFLHRLAAVPLLPAPPPRGRGRKTVPVSAEESLQEALFKAWERPDPTPAFRWDPAEDMRYALLPADPSGEKTTTQHGANRLAAVGVASLPVVPTLRRGRVRASVPGGEGSFRFAWPIWRDAAGLRTIEALLSHPDLREPQRLSYLGIIEVRVAVRLNVGKFMNFGPGRALAGTTAAVS